MSRIPISAMSVIKKHFKYITLMNISKTLAHESGRYKWDECDNIEQGMCEFKEHMIMRVNIFKTLMSRVHISEMSVVM